jgi:hypothetical protein
LVDAQLGQHVLAPELLQRQRAKHPAVRVDEETDGARSFIVAVPQPGSGPGHVFRVLHFDKDRPFLPASSNDADGEVEGCAVI